MNAGISSRKFMCLLFSCCPASSLALSAWFHLFKPAPRVGIEPACEQRNQRPGEDFALDKTHAIRSQWRDGRGCAPRRTGPMSEVPPTNAALDSALPSAPSARSSFRWRQRLAACLQRAPAFTSTGSTHERIPLRETDDVPPKPCSQDDSGATSTFSPMQWES
jgi:hypothetical protein